MNDLIFTKYVFTGKGYFTWEKKKKAEDRS